MTVPRRPISRDMRSYASPPPTPAHKVIASIPYDGGRRTAQVVAMPSQGVVEHDSPRVWALEDYPAAMAHAEARREAFQALLFYDANGRFE